MNHPDAEDLTRTLRGPRTLLEMCLDLRMAHSGSADPISEEETAAALAYLNYRLATWKPSVLPSGARFDECVRALVLATIIEVQCHQTERARVLGLPEIRSPITDAAIDAAKPWTPESWNTCPKCKSPVEKAGGDVEFFDGSEARCIGCKTVYMVSFAEDGGPGSLYEPEQDQLAGLPEAERTRIVAAAEKAQADRDNPWRTPSTVRWLDAQKSAAEREPQ